MAPRSPARWLAPLALVAAAVALLVILSSSSTDQPAQDSAPLAPETTGTATSERHATTTTSTAATTTTPTGPTSTEKTYTVQAGDYLSTVSEKTGLSVDRLRELNPGLDANSMTVGEEIKLQP
jgi:LysM repeat protein